MLWIKKNASLLIGVCAALAIGLSLGYGLRGLDKTEEEPEPTIEPVAAVGDPGILPNTKVTMRYKFLLCGHELEMIEYDGQFTGLTSEDISKRFLNTHVAELNSDEAIIERELESYCPDHFLLMLKDGDKLCISHTDKTDPETTNTQVLSYDVSVLPDNALMMLQEGCVFDELEQINAFLEDVES